MIQPNSILNGDCLEVMREIPDKSVSLVLCDLPYGVLNRNNPNSKWDSIIPFEPLWEQYRRITKPNAAIVLFAQGMFTAKLMMSNPDWWRYNLVWKKGNRVSGFLNANRQPMRNHEDICVFSSGQTIYNPQFSLGAKCHSRGKAGNASGKSALNRNYGSFNQTPTILTNKKYPLSVLDFDKEHGKQWHQTQKPISLLSYLIRTYSNQFDTVLDNTCGSGSTCVAAVLTGRKYIGIERDANYYKIACERTRQAEMEFNTDLCELPTSL